MKNYLVTAIQSLRPGAEFSFTEDNYATIEWHILEGTAPTKAEIEKEIVKIKAADEKAKVSAETAKAELLGRLGITAEEAKLLLG
jgi:hypothetical protein